MQVHGGFGMGKSDARGGAEKGPTQSRSKGKCFYCQREGHWKRDCFKRKADKAKEVNQHTGAEQVGLAFTVLENTSKRQGYEGWILDSGASQHLCSTRKSFIEGTYREISRRGIEIADGSRIQAIGIGDVSIGQLRLSSVLHVPQVGGNLISIARLIDCGYEVQFAAQSCTISNRQLRIEAIREGNLYYVQTLPSYDKANIGLATNKSMPVTIEVWHRRLGHRTLDENTIRFLGPRVSEFHVRTSKNPEIRTEVCGTCAIGRQNKEPMTGTKEKALELLEVVHSDICGPMQVGTITGERYFITFID